jgi:glutaredoxin
VKLYICWGTFQRPGGHACAKADRALRQAGHRPEVIRSYGSARLPDFLNLTPGRREAKRLTGRTTVPVLVTDDQQVIADSARIVAWARDNPAR